MRAPASDHRRGPRSRPYAGTTACAALLAGAVVLTACSATWRQTAALDAAYPPPNSCVRTVMATVAQMARRAYNEVATGRVVSDAVLETERAGALARAAASGNAPAARKAAAALAAQTPIAFLRVERRGRLLASVGRGPAIAGTSGLWRDRGRRPMGSFTLAIQGDSGYAAVVSGLTQADVLVRRGNEQLAGTMWPGPPSLPAEGWTTYRGTAYAVESFRATGYPIGAARVSLLVGPNAFVACAATPAQTMSNIIGPAAMRIYAHENASHSELTALGYIEGSRAFAAAVARGDAQAARQAIIGFFRSHRHIVRVRAMRGNELVTDVGGPYVLAPVQGVLHLGRRIVGRFETAIQDDAGFVNLTTAYTGAQVILRAGARQVPSSTLRPGPPRIPAHGPITYRGESYQAFSFTAEAFPSGPLRVSVLVPAG